MLSFPKKFAFEKLYFGAFTPEFNSSDLIIADLILLWNAALSGVIWEFFILDSYAVWLSVVADRRAVDILEFDIGSTSIYC